MPIVKALEGAVGRGMTDPDPSAARAERLAAALRENLRKRKAQARAAPDAPMPPPIDPER